MSETKPSSSPTIIILNKGIYSSKSFKFMNFLMMDHIDHSWANDFTDSVSQVYDFILF